MLGGVWHSAAELIAPVTLSVAGAGLGTGAAAGLRALGAARRSLRSQLFASACYVGGGLGGAAVAGTVGSAWGVAAATVSGSAVWWLHLRSALRERHHELPSRSEDFMTPHPRLSIGLPVYNGEEYLAESLDALLGQTYEDFELVISDNASTDATEDICRRYAALDPRIRYLRLPRNIGATPNHNRVFAESRGELFKWASHDDLYGRDLLRRCVEALDERPDVILAHAGQAVIDGDGRLKVPYEYGLATDSPCPPERFRSLLFEPRWRRLLRGDAGRHAAPGEAARQLPPRGPHVRRRDHPARALPPGAGTAVLPPRPPRPRRAGEPVQARPVRQPGPAPGRTAAPHAPAARRVRAGVSSRRSGGRRCPRPTDARATPPGRMMTSRVRPGAGERVEDRAPVDPAQLTVSVDALVAGREGRQA